MGDSQTSTGGLIHVHVCVNCGTLTRREAFEGRALSSGIFTCPKCGDEGPLNVEIRSMQELSAQAIKIL
jgi:predicted RNA-binding Zn-ribbon protein involved in translation (DUF1610 family)